MTHLLPDLWITIIAFCLMMYVILDGFTLGTGMLLPIMHRDERDTAMSMLLPTWDGNQTWLVLAMASLYGAFPSAFSYLLPVLYVPIMLLVLALLFRGICFEFRLKSKQGIHRWDILFAIASLTATFIQGLIVGTAAQGFSAHGASLILNGFSLLTGVALVIGYVILGATRLILKTTGTLRTRMYPLSGCLTVLLLLLVAVIAFQTPETAFSEQAAQLHEAVVVASLVVLLLVFLVFVAGLVKKQDNLPYWCTVVMFVILYLTMCFSLYPYVVPYRMTIFQAASPDNTLIFLLVGALIMIPVLLFYTGYAYHVFRGKVKEKLEY